jgi:hypothetical protein
MSRKSARSRRPRPSLSGPILMASSALALVVALVFGPSVGGSFAYDSFGEVLQWDWLHDHRNIRPVGLAWMMFNSLFWGREAYGYHLSSVVLHLFSTLAVFLLIRKVLALERPERDPARRNFIAFLAALLFALHPLVVETICEPSNCKDLLSTLFLLTGVLLAARHRPGWGAGDPTRVVLVPFLCLLSIGTKELGAAFPLILLAYWLIFRFREPRAYWAGIVAASGVVSVLFLFARFALEHHPSEIFLVAPIYPGGNLSNTLLSIQPRIFALYLYNFFWPLHLCADYGVYSVRNLTLGLSYALVLVTVGGLSWWSWRDRRTRFATVFLVATLLPVSNLVPIYHAAADRFLYAPLVAAVLLVALVLDHPWLAARRFRTEAATWGFVFLLGLLVPITLTQEGVWSTDLSLWQATLKENPDSFPGLANTPEIFYDHGSYQEAKITAQTALRGRVKSWPWTWAVYALSLDELGDRAAADRAAQWALKLKPDITDTDKMVRTLQADRPMAGAFARLVARDRLSPR